ncbi:MAG: SOS response-associated peptidase [Coprobacillus sp.]
MCGRYYCDYETYSFISDMTDESDIEDECDFCPGQEIPVIIIKDGETVLEKFSWGYSTNQALVINARCETLLEKKMFSDDASKRRCLIPAKGFYEWDARKNKLSFQSHQDKILLMAGIYREKQKEVVIITTSANQVMKPIHSRMPLIIKKENMKKWLLNEEKTKEFLNSSFDELEIVSGNMQQSFFE